MQDSKKCSDVMAKCVKDGLVAFCDLFSTLSVSKMLGESDDEFKKRVIAKMESSAR